MSSQFVLKLNAALSTNLASTVIGNGSSQINISPAAFLVDICGCSQNWTADSFIETTIDALRQKLGDDKVVLGLSGGVDSSVVAALLSR